MGLNAEILVLFNFTYFTLDKMMPNTRAVGSDRNNKIIIFS